MPQVPQYSNFQATPNVQPFSRHDMFQDPNAPSPGAVAGQQLQGLGNAMSETGSQLNRIAIDAQNDIDQARGLDAMTQAQRAALNLTYDPQAGFLSLKGAAALDRPGATALPEEYSRKLQDQFDSIAAGLGNDAQRQAFHQRSQALLTQFQGHVQQHMLAEAQNYKLSSYNGVVDLAQDTATKAFNDPSTVSQQLQMAQQATVLKGKLLGWAPEQTAEALLQVSSGVHRAVVMSALQAGDTQTALDYFNRNTATMSGPDLLKLGGLVGTASSQAQSQAAVTKAASDTAPRFAPSSFDQMVAITAAAESGNKDVDGNGQLITSAKGAKGSMQVLDSTMAKPGLPGVKPLDPDTATPDQRAQFGRDYLQALLRKYDGDPAKAWAAYNAGFGAVDKAIADAQKTGQPWLAAAPQETQTYVQANMSKLQAGGQVQQPTELQFVNAALANLPQGASPQTVATTRDNAMHQYGLISKDLAQRGEQAVANAQRWIINNGGDIANLPPDLKSQVTQFAPGHMQSLASFGSALAKGDNATEPAMYLELTSHPEKMAQMSDSQFLLLRSQLSPSDFNHFAKERATILNGKTDESAGAINADAVNFEVNNRLRSIGIDPDKAPKDQVGTIYKFVRDGIFAQQAQTGQKMTAAQITTFIDQQFARNAQLRDLWSFGGTKPGLMLGMKISDVPVDQQDQIRARLAARNLPTNDDAVLRTYWNLSNAK